MTEAKTVQPPAAAGPSPAPSAAPVWPSLRPITPGSPIIETWGGYAAPCMDCGFMVKGKTPEEVRDALADRDSWHGFQACRDAARRLSEAEKTRLQQLDLGEAPAEPKGRKKAAKPTKRAS